MTYLPAPTPLVSASVYGQKQHDLLLADFLEPFWAESPLKRAGGFFWTLRYGARGEHLKLRLHGPAALEQETRGSLSAVLDSFVASLPASAGEPAPASPFFPAIDAEDEEEGTRPDRFWRFTTHRHSPFVLGAVKLAQNEEFAAAFAYAQSAVAEIVMSQVSPRRQDASFASSRQTLFIRLLLSAFSAGGLSSGEAAAYLRHHRDWLVRNFLSKSRAPDATEETILAPMRQRIGAMGPTLAALRAQLAAALRPQFADPLFALWVERTAPFFACIRAFRGDPEYDLDPFTRDFTFLPIFKLLHGAGNQFGLPPSNELYTYELLLTAAGEAEGPA